MRLRKAEKEALATLLQQGAETPEQLVDSFVDLLDELRGARPHHFACAVVAGIPLAIGPYTTRAQAKKAIDRFPAEQKWVVPGWTDEGWVTHLATVDATPAPHKLSSAEERKREAGFWAKARPIMDGEANGLVVKGRGVQVTLVKKGHWG